MTNAEARFNKYLRPRKPEGSLGRTAQDVHLDSHTAPELLSADGVGYWTYYRSVGWELAEPGHSDGLLALRRRLTPSLSPCLGYSYRQQSTCFAQHLLCPAPALPSSSTWREAFKLFLVMVMLTTERENSNSKTLLCSRIVALGPFGPI